VKAYVTLCVQGLEEYERIVSNLLSSGSERAKAKFREYESCNVEDISDEAKRKEAIFVQSMIQTLSALKMRIDDINEDHLSFWRKSFARERKQTDLIRSVEALARFASAIILKNETPKRLRALCETKAKKLGMDPEGSEFLVSGFVEILEELRNLVEQESRGLQQHGGSVYPSVDRARSCLQ
jgi:hypothetical protein